MDWIQTVVAAFGALSTSGFITSVVAWRKQAQDNKKQQAEIVALKADTDTKLENAQFQFIEKMELLQERQVGRLETQLNKCWEQTTKLRDENEFLRDRVFMLEAILQDNKVPIPA